VLARSDTVEKPPPEVITPPNEPEHTVSAVPVHWNCSWLVTGMSGYAALTVYCSPQMGRYLLVICVAPTEVT
jgi:hypothetical protein